MKSERLFSIVNHLLERRRATADELASRFGVSVRTIYRDMDSLCASGVPIVASQGYEGGFELAEGFKIDRTFLSPPELSDLTGVLRGFDEALKSGALSSSLGKLSGLGARGRPAGDGAGRGSRVSASRGAKGETAELPPPLLVTLTPWGGPSPDAATIDVFRRAIEARRPVRLVYADAQGRSSERVVEPYTVALGGPVWYVHAWCRERRDFRLFRLSRVRKAQLERGNFDPFAHGPIPHPFTGSGSEPMLDVVLDAPASARATLAEAFGERALARLDSGGVRASFSYPAGEWLVRFVLSLGSGISVVAPLSLRRELKAAAEEAARLNG